MVISLLWLVSLMLFSSAVSSMLSRLGLGVSSIDFCVELAGLEGASFAVELFGLGVCFLVLLAMGLAFWLLVVAGV